jgi:hypothetical protein
LILIKQLVGFSVLLIHICNLSLAIHPMTKVTGVLAILNKKAGKKSLLMEI